MKNILVLLSFLHMTMPVEGQIQRNFGNTLDGCREPRRYSDANLCKRVQSRSFFKRYRTILGICNNLFTGNTTVGSSGTITPRLLDAKYFDHYGRDTPLGHPSLPKNFGVNAKSPQDISDIIFDISSIDHGNRGKVSTIYMTFGQFLDHDFAYHVHPAGCGENCNVTEGDFDYPCFPITRENRPNQCVGFARSIPVCQGRRREVRQQPNNVTAYIDGSAIYGSIHEVYRQVRDGKTPYLAVTKTDNQGDLLPMNLQSDEICNRKGGCFIAGDTRVNENTALAAMHTVWMRLHNYFAREIERLGTQNPYLFKSINKYKRKFNRNRIIFHESRKIVVAILQHIVYEEWLPKLTDISPYKGYKVNIRGEVSNEFQTAAFRFGHTLVPNNFKRLFPNFTRAEPRISVRNSFFNNLPIVNNGIEPIMFGLFGNNGEAEDFDSTFSASIGRRLFIEPRQRGFQNLMALNIQRGRDHGLESYSKYREFCGIPNAKQVGDNPFTAFRNEIRNYAILRDFQKAYVDPKNHIDLFVGGMSESNDGDKMLGRTFGCILKKTFEDLRDGDRFFYKNDKIFSAKQQKEIEKMTLAKVMCLTLRNAESLQQNLFDVFRPYREQRISCKHLIRDSLDVKEWLLNSIIKI